MNKNIKLALKHGAKIIPFKNLPKEYQYALIHYMAVDGEAWEASDQLAASYKVYWKKGDRSIIKRALRNKKSMEFYVTKYGDWKFGVADIPTEKIVSRIMQEREIKKDFDSFPEYQKWAKGSAYWPRHPRKNRWPCILSSFNDEALEDGWSRFHVYSSRGDSNIPCVFYPNNCEPKKVRRKFT